MRNRFRLIAAQLYQVNVDGKKQNSLRKVKACGFKGNAGGADAVKGLVGAGMAVVDRGRKFVLCGGTSGGSVQRDVNTLNSL